MLAFRCTFTSSDWVLAAEQEGMSCSHLISVFLPPLGGQTRKREAGLMTADAATISLSLPIQS